MLTLKKNFPSNLCCQLNNRDKFLAIAVTVQTFPYMNANEKWRDSWLWISEATPSFPQSQDTPVSLQMLVSLLMLRVMCRCAVVLKYK